MAVVLGIHAAFNSNVHDPSACLVIDGNLTYAIEEERLNRIKTSPGFFPERSIKAALQFSNLNISDLDAVAIDGTTSKALVPKVKKHFNYLFGVTPRILTIPHPLAHGSGAFYSSVFDRALVVSIDGVGDGISVLAYIEDRYSKRQLVYKEAMPASFGAFYTAFTNFMGFRSIEGEYKLMGMAAYGDPSRFNLDDLFGFSSALGRLYIDSRLIDSTTASSCFESHANIDFISNMLSINPCPAHNPNWTQEHFDLAASVQRRFAKSYQELIMFLVHKTGISQVCLSGGCALNCLANMPLICDYGLDLYVQPAASDRGLSIGSAFEVSRFLGDHPRPCADMYLGNSYDDNHILNSIQDSGLRYSKPDNIALLGAKLLTEGNVIGWFQGRSEFGPRALGARSILASSSLDGNKDRINKKIKFRELFRPFAPAVLLSEIKSLTGLDVRSPYMTTTLPVLEIARSVISQCCHRDCTARFQTVEDTSSPLYSILMHTKDLTGTGACINTSFNLAGEPIVETPSDALRTFISSGLDYLCIGDYLVNKRV